MIEYPIQYRICHKDLKQAAHTWLFNIQNSFSKKNVVKLVSVSLHVTTVHKYHKEMKLYINFLQFLMKTKSSYGPWILSMCSPQRQAGEFHLQQLNGINIIVYQNYSPF